MNSTFLCFMTSLFILSASFNSYAQQRMNKHRSIGSINLMAYSFNITDYEELTGSHGLSSSSQRRKAGVELGHSIKIKNKTFFNAHLVYNTLDIVQRIEFDQPIDIWTSGIKDIKPIENTTIHNITVKVGIEKYYDIGESWRIFGDAHAGIFLNSQVEDSRVEPLSPPIELELDPVPVEVEYSFNVTNQGMQLLPIASLGIGFEKDIEDDFYFRFGGRYNIILGQAFQFENSELLVSDQLINQFNYGLSIRLFQFYIGAVYEW